MTPEAGKAMLRDRGTVQRMGVIDVGSNSVRLVVFDGVARSPAYFYNEKILCGLGKGIHETGALNPEGQVRAMAALRRFAALARLMNLTGLKAVATAAVRDASNGPAFRDRVRAETGLDLEVVSGAEEAALSARGVLLGWPGANGLVCDIGGASMELAVLEGGKIGARATSPLGPLQLASLDSKKAVDAEISRCMKDLRKQVPGSVARIFLVGGSWRAIAKLDMERNNYPLKVLHEYRFAPDQAVATCKWLASQTGSDLTSLTDTSAARLELVPLAARVLPALIKTFKPTEVAVSAFGLREGVLYEMMPPELRARDPLLESARHMERSRARFPGFGDALFEWLMPLYKGRDRTELRVIHAACLLHDITWRAHPDYRAEVCFETATRANLSGLDHQERVFLGLSILHRYRSGARNSFDPAVIGLLPVPRQQDAESLGKAMRLGAMLTGTAPEALRDTRLDLGDGQLTLTLRGAAVALGGEAVQRRLEALAARLGVAAHLHVPGEALPPD